MAYYTLCTKDEGGKLHVQFGDREREVVVQEKADSYRGVSTVLVKSASARQSDVNKAIAAMELTIAAERKKLSDGLARTIARRRAV